MAYVQLADVKQYIGLTSANGVPSANDDYLLNMMIAAADAAAEYWFGAIGEITVTGEVHDGGHPTILLRVTPVISIESMIEYVGVTPYVLTSQPPGSTVNNYGYSLDRPEDGLVTRRSGAGTPMPFLGGPRMVVVSYTAGRTTVPPDIQMAITEDIRAWWEQTQQGGRPNFGGGEGDSWSPNSLHLFPRLAAIATSSERTPGVA